MEGLKEPPFMVNLRKGNKSVPPPETDGEFNKYQEKRKPKFKFPKWLVDVS